jgi:1-acyl-sn-glycerol-3-phosphate acyltransferase
VNDPSREWAPLPAAATTSLRGLPRLVAALVVFVCFTLLARVWLLFGGSARTVRAVWLRRGARVELAVLGLSLAVEGALDHAGPVIIVANHGSLLDVLVFGALLPRPARALLRREFARIPLLGPVLRAAGHILVDRDRPRGAARSFMAAARALADGDAVLVFPEGTRHLHGTLGAFRAGALRLAAHTHAPILPITVLNGAAHLPRGSVTPRPGVIRVVVGAPIDTTSWGVATLSAHVAEVRAAVAAPLARYRDERARAADEEEGEARSASSSTDRQRAIVPAGRER